MTTDEDHPELVQTHALADGELRGEELLLAQEHLATCTRCQAELSDLMQLEAMPMPRPTNVVSLAWYRRKSVQVASVAVFAAAAVAVLYVGKKPAAVVDHHDAPKVALAEKRALEARVSWAGASDYRAYSVPRGQSLAKEPISLAAMADLEKAGDLHGVGALALLGGDLEQAKKYLALAGETPDVMADHAALELSLGHPAAALMLADGALEKKPDDPIATWNRALAMRDLGLNHVAAEAFRAVAKHAEAGWSAEATQRADLLDKSFHDELDRQQRLWEAINTPSVDHMISLDDAREMPGLGRIWIYETLRSSDTAEQIAKLKPLAEVIDTTEPGAKMVAIVANAKPDPIAAKAYRDLLALYQQVDNSNADETTKWAAAQPAVDKLIAVLRARKANDALVVAFLKVTRDGEVPDKDLAEQSRLAAASADPWIQLIGVEQRATKLVDKGDLIGAETVLLTAKPICDAAGVSYRCMKIARLLGDTYLGWQRFQEARAAYMDAYKRARDLSSLADQGEVNIQLAQVSILSDDTVGGGLPLVRAYAQEYATQRLIELPDEQCEPLHIQHERIATALMIQLRVGEAARELAAAPQCRVSTWILTVDLYLRGEILRLEGTAPQIATFRKDVADARTRPDLTAGLNALLDHAEGRAIVSTNVAEGEKLLRRAIEDAAKQPKDNNGQRAASASYATLAVLAAKRGDVAASFDVLAQELGTDPRPSCVLGLILDDRDVVAIARDAAGKPVVGTYERPTLSLEPEKIVPGRVVDALRACADVDVIARPPFHGLARILPDEIAWRYVTRSTKSTPATPANTSIVVDDVQPPAALSLPRLSSFPVDNAVVIHGASATPSRVLTAMSATRDILINAHGLADLGEASYLALSPDADGRYALTTADIVRAKLTSHPLVILAACEGAKSAPVFHARWSLPAAFITAGARAVVASTSAIPDADAGAFFGELRARALAGEPLAAALRDLRKKWLVTPNTNFWVRDVVVFE